MHINGHSGIQYTMISNRRNSKVAVQHTSPSAPSPRERDPPLRLERGPFLDRTHASLSCRLSERCRAPRSPHSLARIGAAGILRAQQTELLLRRRGGFPARKGRRRAGVRGVEWGRRGRRHGGDGRQRRRGPWALMIRSERFRDVVQGRRADGIARCVDRGDEHGFGLDPGKSSSHRVE